MQPCRASHGIVDARFSANYEMPSCPRRRSSTDVCKCLSPTCDNTTFGCKRGQCSGPFRVSGQQAPIYDTTGENGVRVPRSWLSRVRLSRLRITLRPGFGRLTPPGLGRLTAQANGSRLRSVDASGRRWSAGAGLPGGSRPRSVDASGRPRSADAFLPGGSRPRSVDASGQPGRPSRPGFGRLTPPGLGR